MDEFVKGDHIEADPIDLPLWSVVVDTEGRILQKDRNDHWMNLDLFIPCRKISFPVEVVRVGP